MEVVDWLGHEKAAQERGRMEKEKEEWERMVVGGIGRVSVFVGSGLPTPFGFCQCGQAS